MNLNNLKINNSNGEDIDLYNNNKSIQNCKFDIFEVFFKDLENELIKKINEFKNDIIFGSVAWLTSINILKALSKCNNVQIIIQKEDFLRPDLNITINNSEWKQNLRKYYNNISCSMFRMDFNEPIQDLSIFADSYHYPVESIRCVGNYNRDKNPAFPRAHNKFLVFCKKNETRSNINKKIENEIPLIENINCIELIKEIEYYNNINCSKELMEIIISSKKHSLARKFLESKYDWNNIKSYNPIAVWTGSFNFTKNAGNSFENAIYFSDKSGNNEIINSYLNEHHQIFCLSESLDWKNDWCEPEFRIGT
jgi:hypothetical protein